MLLARTLLARARRESGAPLPASRPLGPALRLALALGLVVTGCATDGRSLSRPTAEQTTTTRAPLPATSNTPTTQVMTMTSASFSDGDTIPDAHTCRGEDISPSLTWSHVPAGTAELAIVVRDLDAEGFIHWVVTGIPATVGGISEGTVPQGAVEALNDLGRPGWVGPCPDSGTHHYEFQLYALRGQSGLPATTPGRQAAEEVLSAFTHATAVISGTVTAP